MNLLERLQGLLETFRFLFPTRMPPPRQTLVVWANYPVECIERGMLRAQRKFAGTTVTDDELCRYISGVARHESLGLRTVPPRQGAA